MSKVSIHAQIMEIDYELAMRHRVYPGLVRAGKMKQAEADLHIAQLGAVRETLAFCRAHEADIRAYIKARKAESAS